MTPLAATVEALFAPPSEPKVTFPPRVRLLVMVRMAVSLTRAVPLAITRVAVPRAALLPSESVPAFRLNVPEKVFAPVRPRVPLPVLVRVVGPAIGAAMTSDTGASPEALMVAVAGRVSRVPEMVGTVAGLSLTALIGVAEFMVSDVVPTATVGLAVPPVLLNVRLFRVLAKFPRVRTPPPLIVTSLAELIWLTAVVAVRVEPLMVTPPAGRV